MHIALAVSHEYLGKLTDERLLADALTTLDHTTQEAIWNDPTVDWAAYDAVIVRATWDYHHHLPAFLTWLEDLQAQGVTVYNPPDVMRWNTNKRYIADLNAAGVMTPKTVFIPKGVPADIVTVMWQNSIEVAVLKLAVSAGAWGSILMDRTRAAKQGNDVIQALAFRSDVMVQEYVPQIKEGETSLIFIGGRYSHAVKKVPSERDYRAQELYGADITPVDPPYRIVEQASTILQTAADLRQIDVRDLLYARVDVVEVDGQAMLMELELVEPSLFLESHPAAAHQVAEAITNLPVAP